LRNFRLQTIGGVGEKWRKVENKSGNIIYLKRVKIEETVDGL